jgi:hypothetical protein
MSMLKTGTGTVPFRYIRYGIKSQVSFVHSSSHVQMSMLKTGTGTVPFRHIRYGSNSQMSSVHSSPHVQMSMLKENGYSSLQVP